MEALGINPVSIVIYTLLFIVVYLVLNKYVVKAVLQMLEKRQLTVKENLDLKSNLEKQLEEMEVKRKEVFSSTKAEAQKTVTEVMNEAKKEKVKIIEEAKKEAQNIIEKAEKLLDQERVKMQGEMDEKVAAAARKVVNEIYQQNKLEIDKKLIAKALEELKS